MEVSGQLYAPGFSTPG